MKNIKAIIFDAYGTLFDVNSAAEKCRSKIGDKWESFANYWRKTQLEYTWLRSLMGRHKDFWEISKHPKLVWMILCAINPEIGSFNRKYLPMKKNVKDNKKTKFLRELYPTWKLSDIEAYAEMCDKKELKQLAIEHGYDDKSIREKL